MYVIGKFCLISLMILSISACSVTKEPEQNTAQSNQPVQTPVKQKPKLDLRQKHGWLLKQISDDNGNLVNVDDDIRITLVFKNSEIRGNNSCNLYFSSFKSSADQIEFSNLSTTLKACSDNIMQQSQSYLKHLQQIASYQIVDGQLLLNNKSGQTLLRFSVDDPAQLIDIEWKLQFLNTGNALVNNAAIATVTAKFSSTLEIKGFTGCNQYAGVYEKFENQFRFLKIVPYQKKCTRDEIEDETEKQFIEAAGRVRRFTLTADTLTFLDEKNIKILVFKH